MIIAFLIQIFLFASSALLRTLPAHSPVVPPVHSPLVEGLSRSDWDGIRSAHEAQRYAVQPAGLGHQAHNPGQAWRTRFDGHGFLVEPEAGGWTWGLELRAYGFEGNEQAVRDAARVRTEGGGIAYEWGASLEEWFVNDRRGLEHGFNVHRRPAGEKAAGEGPLTFTLAVRGGLRPEVQEGGLGVRFLDAGNNLILTYAGLSVFDADGRSLEASLDCVDAGGLWLQLSVEERGARYPLRIDPLAQQAYLKASNTEANDKFGSSVAVFGNTVVVGAPGHGWQAPGAAYVFERSGTSWTQQAFLTASNPDNADCFGCAVAVSGNTVVVGASREESSAAGVNGNQSDNSLYGAGAAYVFVRSGTTWSQEAYLKASNPGPDIFGEAVGVAGDTIVIGASNERSNATGVNGNQSNNSSVGAGAAYVFVRSGTTWSQEAYLKASNTGVWYELFGASVSVSGDLVIVGAAWEDSNATGVNGNQGDESAFNAGAAYVFVRSGTTWSQEAYLKASNTDASDEFGWSVSVSGNTAVVGAIAETSNATGVNGNQGDNSSSYAGAAYVFVRSGTSWSQEAYLKASNTDAGHSFGGSVSVSGDTAVVGAIGESSNATGVNGNQSDNSAPTSGAAYVFTRTGTSWSQRSYLKASNTDANDRFGSVSVSGDTVVVGALLEDSSATGVNGNQSDNSASKAGAAYVFALIPGLTSYCPLTPNSAGSGAMIGVSGSTSVAANDLGFLAGPMAAGEPGIFYYGPDQLQVPFGEGNRCVGGGPGTIVRMFPFAFADASGFMGTTLDNTGPAHGQVLPAVTLHFQAWFRDPLGGGAGFNLSDALSVVFSL